MIPIEDEVGQLVGYCGRSLNGNEPRYNFPPGFPKSQLLFNLHRAVSTRQSHVIVVEGFFDCLKVYQAGFGSVVALMGSCLYEEQCRLLVEHFHHITLMLDGDLTGRRAQLQYRASSVSSSFDRCHRTSKGHPTRPAHRAVSAPDARPERRNRTLSRTGLCLTIPPLKSGFPERVAVRHLPIGNSPDKSRVPIIALIAAKHCDRRV